MIFKLNVKFEKSVMRNKRTILIKHQEIITDVGKKIDESSKNINRNISILNMK